MAKIQATGRPEGVINMIGMAERSEWEGGRSPLPNFLLLDLSTTCTPEWIGPFQVPKKTLWISKMQTIQPKILDFLGAKLEKFRRFGYTLRGCPVFGNFEKCWKFKLDLLVEWKASPVKASSVTLRGDIKQALYVFEQRKPRAIKRKWHFLGSYIKVDPLPRWFNGYVVWKPISINPLR